MFKQSKKKKVITVYDVYKNLRIGTKVNIFETGTMKKLTIEEAKEKEIGLIVPSGELKINIFC